ncbi:MAG: NYN domain-containing protein [Planctomycetaceae bacterium]|nr:NYN domain-containing protein [Planctomycetaceae bacterium]
MPIVIDTYNVTETVGVLPPELAGVDAEGLARLIAASRFRHEAVLLVCDGRPRSAARFGRIVIEGSAGHGSADARIAAIVRAHSAPRTLTVVSTDREVARTARARGAATWTSAEFLGFLVDDWSRGKPRRPAPPDPRRSVPLSDGEVAAWMRLFAVSDELVAIERSEPIGGASAEPARPMAPHGAPPRGDGDAVLEKFLERTKGLADPLSIFESSHGDALLAELAALDHGTIDELMRRHEPSETKDGARIGGRRRTKRRKSP